MPELKGYAGRVRWGGAVDELARVLVAAQSLSTEPLRRSSERKARRYIRTKEVRPTTKVMQVSLASFDSTLIVQRPDGSLGRVYSEG
jgi:hypothetical protein